MNPPFSNSKLKKQESKGFLFAKPRALPKGKERGCQSDCCFSSPFEKERSLAKKDGEPLLPFLFANKAGRGAQACASACLTSPLPPAASTMGGDKAAVIRRGEAAARGPRARLNAP